ncbi:MAG: hypothetical protein MZV64_17175 [Ignavibacteriales bacterium]|nr:hypothetical protein [Ignavibacteriales bacterium]
MRRERIHAGAETRSKRKRSQLAIGPLMTASVQSRKGDETSITRRKTIYITAKKKGRPSHLWVTISSMRSVRVMRSRSGR